MLWWINKQHAPAVYTCTAGYTYTDAEGIAVGVALRFESPDEPKQFGQIRPEGAGWITSGPDRPPLYRLPEVLAATPESFIFWPEGEKDADRLRG